MNFVFRTIITGCSFFLFYTISAQSILDEHVFRTIITGCSFFLFYTISAQSILDDKVEKRLKTLTLEEKVGQMSQIDLGVLAVGKICEVADPIRLDTAKLRLAFQRYKVGSVLNCGCGFHALSRIK